MIQAGLLAIALLVAVVVPAGADWFNARVALADATADWRRAESLYQALADQSTQQQPPTQHQATGGDVIRPPDANIDPKMTVIPPKQHGTMRVIPPKEHGTMRVIPPPGAPGATQNIEPK